jgi:hypothetical protein
MLVYPSLRCLESGVYVRPYPARLRINSTDSLPLFLFAFLPHLLDAKAFPERQRRCRIKFETAAGFRVR